MKSFKVLLSQKLSSRAANRRRNKICPANEIFSLNVESLPELNRVNMVASGLNIRALHQRINPDVDPDTHPTLRQDYVKTNSGCQWKTG